MYILMNALYLAAGIRWGDWRNWQRYYPTILFFIVGDFLYNFLLYNKTMWLFHDVILPNHTTITLLSMAVSYTATVLIYLGRFPDGWLQRLLWFLLWSGIFLMVDATASLALSPIIMAGISAGLSSLQALFL